MNNEIINQIVFLLCRISVSTPVVKTTKSPPISPSLQQSKMPIISGVYDGTPGVGTQEAIVERAKQVSVVHRHYFGKFKQNTVHFKTLVHQMLFLLGNMICTISDSFDDRSLQCCFQGWLVLQFWQYQLLQKILFM